MRFIALCLVATLALTVSAELHESNLDAHHNSEHVKEAYTTVPEKYQVAAEHLLEAVRIVFPKVVVNAVELSWKTTVRMVELVPADVTENLITIYNNLPTVQQLYPEQFVEAIENVIESAKNALLPPKVWNWLNDLVNGLPTVADFIGRELLNSVGIKLNKIPIVRELLKNVYLVLEHLVHSFTY